MNKENVETIALIMKLMNKGLYNPVSEVLDKSYELVKNRAEKETGKKLTFSRRYNKFLNNKYKN